MDAKKEKLAKILPKNKKKKKCNTHYIPVLPLYFQAKKFKNVKNGLHFFNEGFPKMYLRYSNIKFLALTCSA